jgi:hypothetical protein
MRAAQKPLTLATTLILLAGTAYADIHIEAEDYITKTEFPAGHAWQFTTNRPGHLGNGAMQAVPDDNRTFKNNLHRSPRMDYRVTFPTAGRHYVWVRGLADSPSAASLHVGLDGSPQELYLAATGDYVWAGGNVIDIPSAGEHTVSVWMRDSGPIVDALAFSADSAFVPSDDTVIGDSSQEGDSQVADGSGDSGTGGTDDGGSADSGTGGIDDEGGETADGSSADEPVETTPLIAVNDYATTELDTPVNVDVLANDTYPSGTSVSLSSSPQAGSAKVQSDYTVTYTPDGGYFGADSFIYRISDTTGQSAFATVSIEIECSACAVPTALILSWDPSTEDLKGYYVYHGPTPDTSTALLSHLLIAEVEAEEPAVTYESGEIGLKAGDTVCFRVKAYNDVGSSDYSEAACTTI